MKINLQKISWTLWTVVHDEDGDVSIEVPDYLADLIESTENTYSDLVAMLEHLVQTQHGKERVI